MTADKKLNGKQAPKQPVETVAPEGESGRAVHTGQELCKCIRVKYLHLLFLQDKLHLFWIL